MDRKNNPGSMPFDVVVYAFHIDPCLMIRMLFRMPPTCLVLSFIETSVIFFLCYDILLYLLKLQTCHSFELKKKENNLNQVQI